MVARTEDGRPLRILKLIDEYTRECLTLKVARRLRSQGILEQLGVCSFIEDCLALFVARDSNRSLGLECRSK